MLVQIIILWTLTFVVVVTSSPLSYLDELRMKNAMHLRGRVGSHVAFIFNLEFPNDDDSVPYHLSWRKDNLTIFTYESGETRISEQYSGRINFVEKQSDSAKVSLNLTSVRESDSGWYECKLNFPNRTPPNKKNTWYHLEVDGDSLMRVPPVNQTVIEHHPATFDCVVKEPATMTVTWFKDGKSLSTFTDLFARTIQHANGSLTIRETLMNDLGIFECRVKKIFGGEENARAYLNVQYKAKVIYTEKEIFLPFGRSAMLDCHFRANPPLTSLRWEKDGFLFDAYNVKDVFYKHNGSLYFRNVKNSHTGKYTCTPYNELGTEGTSDIIDIIVQHPPEFIVKPKSVYIKRNGEDITINCTAKTAIDEDTNHMIMEWKRKDGIPLPQKRHKIVGGNLTITNLNVDDRGLYICSAKNEAAKIETEVEIIIETFSPKSPSNLTATTTKSSATIRWIQNYVRPELRFQIWYRLVEKNKEEWKSMKVNFTGEFEATVTNLQEDKEYEFMVLSQDRYNDGLMSKPLKVIIKNQNYEEAIAGTMSAFSQIGPPKGNIQLTHRPDSYLLSWEDPEYGKEILDSFIIRWYREPNHQLAGREETREKFLSIPIENLEDDQTYNFQISSISHSQIESYSKEIELKTTHNSLITWSFMSISMVLLLLAFVGISFYGFNIFKHRIR